jgi:hypothetical protein
MGQGRETLWLKAQCSPMRKKFGIEARRRAVSDQAAASGAELRQKYGPQIGWEQLLQILQDRTCVRYPCEIRFDAEPLLPGEFAHPEAKGSQPELGYTIYVHPAFAGQLPRVPYLVLCQLPLVNHGPAASPEAAETFGSCALGMTKEEYFRTLCAMADEIGGDELC